MACKGTCHAYKAERRVKSSSYKLGFKFCTLCALFLDHKGIWCPCCNQKLRVKGRKLTVEVKRI